MLWTTPWRRNVEVEPCPVVGVSGRVVLLLALSGALSCGGTDEGTLFAPAAGSGGAGGGGGTPAEPAPPELPAVDASASPPDERPIAPTNISAGGRGAEQSLADAGRVAVALDAGSLDGSPGDAALPALGGCVLGAFAAPQQVTGLQLDAALSLWSPALSADGLSLYFAVDGPGQNEDLHVTIRAAIGESFGAATPLGGVNSDSADGTPFPAADGLSLYFFSTRNGGTGERDLWRATRSNPTVDFGNAQPLAALNTVFNEHLPTLAQDGRALLFVSTRDDGQGSADIWRATRASEEDEFAGATNLSELNSGALEGRAQQASNGLSIVFGSDRDGGEGGIDLWMASRQSVAEPFSELTNLQALNSDVDDLNASLSFDDRELFFVSTRSGAPRLFRSVRDCQ